MIIKLKNISKTLINKSEKIMILDNVSLNIHNGEIVIIYGNSGVGKSTLLSIIGTLLQPTSGSITFDNNKIIYDSDLYKLRGKKIGFIFQDNYLLPEYNVLENLIIPQLIIGKKYQDSKNNAMNMLSLFELNSLILRHSNEISEGEKQRIALIRSIINEPEIVIADEPTANLDENNCKQLLNLIVKLNKELKKTFIIATHDIRFTAISNSVYNLFEGKITKNE